jgi:hypothetical protein
MIGLTASDSSQGSVLSRLGCLFALPDYLLGRQSLSGLSMALYSDGGGCGGGWWTRGQPTRVTTNETTEVPDRRGEYRSGKCGGDGEWGI